MNQKQKPVGKVSLTPRCDELERQRRALEQGRTAAYGDALSLARRLERALADKQAECDRLNLELGNPIDRAEWAKHQVPAKIPCVSCGCESNVWNADHAPGCVYFPLCG